MPIDLTPWLIAWAGGTTGVLLLLIWRLVVAKDEKQGGIYIVEGEEALLERQTAIASKLKRIDLWGKALTVVSTILMVILGSAWLYNGWWDSNQVIR